MKALIKLVIFAAVMYTLYTAAVKAGYIPNVLGGRFQKIAEQVTLGGKPLKLPITLGELGSDYTFSDVTVSKSERVNKDRTVKTEILQYSGKLCYKGEVIIERIYLDNYSESAPEEAVIFGIQAYNTYSTNGKEECAIKVNGVGIGDMMGEVISAIGEPDKVSGGAKTRAGDFLECYLYEKDGYGVIMFAIEDDICSGVVISIFDGIENPPVLYSK